MDIPDAETALLQQLGNLSRDLGVPGGDLYAMLSVLLDDITEAVPSFLGLQMTMTINHNAIMINAIEPHALNGAEASVLLPLHHLTAGALHCTLTLYAATPGAFTQLADQTCRTFQLDGQIIVDGHLADATDVATPRGVAGATAATLINIAMGILIDQGHRPEHAYQELTRRAAQHNDDLTAAARHLLDSQ